MAPPGCLVRLRVRFSRGSSASRCARPRARRPGRRRRTASRGPACRRVLSRWCASVSARRAPDMPSGWPSAMAPPFGFTWSASSGRPSPRSTASAWLANASLSSMASKSDTARPSRSHELLHRRHRPDAHDARRRRRRVAMPRMRARGMQPMACAPPRVAGSAPPTPSLTPEALPAVTVPSARTIGFSLASVSASCRRADARPCRR